MEHPHAELLRAIADGKQMQSDGADCTARDALLMIADFCADRIRIKPETVTINGIEVPSPVREPLKDGEQYWFVASELATPVSASEWSGDSFDGRMLERGLMHRTRDAALAHFKALITPTKAE
jgi:hypothetical protein